MGFYNAYVMDMSDQDGLKGMLGFYVDDSQPESDGGAYQNWVDWGDGNGWRSWSGLSDAGPGSGGGEERYGRRWHLYAPAGTYTVWASVMAPDGTAAEASTVLVSQDPAPHTQPPPRAP